MSLKQYAGAALGAFMMVSPASAALNAETEIKSIASPDLSAFRGLNGYVVYTPTCRPEGVNKQFMPVAARFCIGTGLISPRRKGSFPIPGQFCNSIQVFGPAGLNRIESMLARYNLTSDEEIHNVFAQLRDQIKGMPVCGKKNLESITPVPIVQ